MQTTVLKRKSRSQQVLDELAQLSNGQLARLMPAMLALRAQRGRHVLPEREAKLLEEINRGLPSRVQAEFDQLVAKRRAGTLTPREAGQLKRLVAKVEFHDAWRLRRLVELAGLRHTTLEKLMRSLGLTTPAYA